MYIDSYDFNTTSKKLLFSRQKSSLNFKLDKIQRIIISELPRLYIEIYNTTSYPAKDQTIAWMRGKKSAF